MTKLYILDLSQFDGGRWRELLPLLPSARRKQVEGCRFEVDQRRIAGAGWLLRYALEENGIPAEQQRFERNQWGKPLLEGRGDLHFNVSHSGNWVVCAVSEEPVGVDVELPRCSLDIARRFFRPEELEGLEQLPWQARRDTLNRLWTAKEAFVKAVGRGLSMKLDSFGVRLSPDGAELDQSWSDFPYVLHEYTLHPSRLCLCTVGPRPEPEFVSF